MREEGRLPARPVRHSQMARPARRGRSGVRCGDVALQGPGAWSRRSTGRRWPTHSVRGWEDRFEMQTPKLLAEATLARKLGLKLRRGQARHVAADCWSWTSRTLTRRPDPRMAQPKGDARSVEWRKSFAGVPEPTRPSCDRASGCRDGRSHRLARRRASQAAGPGGAHLRSLEEVRSPQA